MRRNWGRVPANGWWSLTFNVALLIAVWSGSLVVIGAACRAAIYLFCIGYRC